MSAGELALSPGQHWRARNGACLRVESKSANGWIVYYAKGITETVDNHGRVLGALLDHGFDLIEELK